MEPVLKYYKFFDPFNPLVLTKDIGIVFSGVESLKVQRQNEQKEWVVYQEESKEVVSELTPSYPDLEEISKEEYDFITGEGESEVVTNARKSHLETFNKMTNKESDKTIDIKSKQQEIKLQKLQEFHNYLNK